MGSAKAEGRWVWMAESSVWHWRPQEISLQGWGGKGGRYLDFNSFCYPASPDGWGVSMCLPAVDRDGAILAKLLLGLVYLPNEVDKTFSWFWHTLFWPVGELELTNSSWLTVLGDKTGIVKHPVFVTENRKGKKKTPIFVASLLKGMKSWGNSVV